MWRFFVFALAIAGCADMIPEPSIRHDVKDIKRKSDAQKWSGSYSFTECATPSPCWKYVVVVDNEADVVVSVEGPEPPPRVKGTARVFREGTLTLTFSSYVDETVDVADVGLHVFDPVRGRYTPGQQLAKITRDGSGRPCFTFDGMSSKVGSKTICTSP